MFDLPKLRSNVLHLQALFHISPTLSRRYFYESGKCPPNCRISRTLFLSMVLAHPMPPSLAHKTWLMPAPGPNKIKIEIDLYCCSHIYIITVQSKEI